jgi:hypothetical protein
MLIIAAAAAAALAPLPSSWMERAYSRGVYLAWQRIATSFSNVVPFAIFDILLIAVAVGLVAWWTRAFYREGRRRALRTLGRLATFTIVVAAGVYLWFALAWGFNYRREALTRQLAFDRSRVTPASLLALANRAIARTTALYAAGRDPQWTLNEAQARLGHAFARAQRQLHLPALAVPGRPKPTVFGWYFRLAAIDGMTDPFFLETLINPDVLPVERPFVVAHEWAHLAGYADEGDANFVAWLTCMAADGAAQYSAWLFLASQAYGAVRPAERRALAPRFAAGPRADLTAIQARLARARPFVRSAAREVYDRYLRAHDVEGGITSYGRVIDLILGTELEPDGSPMLRRAQGQGGR